MSTAPEKLAANANRSGCARREADRPEAPGRQACDRAGLTRADRPVVGVHPRQQLADVVVSQRGGPPAPPLYQSAFQPPLPSSGITVITGAPSVIASASPATVQST